jgi:uncharacterized protein YdbL (DUF1318 family)
MRTFTLLATLTLLSSGPAFALDASDAEALASTQQLLGNQNAMLDVAKHDAGAKGAMDQINQITKGDSRQTAEMNAISSSVFADMVKNTNGDSVAVQEKLQLALKDPGAFIKTLTPEQQARLNGLATQVAKQNENRDPASTK